MRSHASCATAALALAASTLSPALAASSNKPVKIFILAGQSNMEGKGNVALVKTDVYWDYHYLGSAKALSSIGQTCAQAVLDLRGESR